MLELKNICFSAKGETGGVEILRNVDLTIPNGKFIVITGPNGGGKSTLAKVIMGVEKPTEGRIFLNGEDITDLSVTERARKGISYGFQAPPRFKGMKVNKVLIPLPDEEKVCPVCGTQMERIGEEYVRRELVFIPATCEINEYYTETYGCPSCKEGKGDTEAAVFAKSQAPDALICKSPASSSTVAWTMYQKYANGMPLYRQEKDWKQYGAAISRTTLANWIIYCAEHYFQPVYHYLHRLLLKRQFAMADETRIQVLNEPERRAETQSFMWLFRSGEDGLPVIILYGYTPTRSGDNAAEFLQGFQGYLEADGYQGYNKVPGIRRCSCWSHYSRSIVIPVIPKKAT